MLCDIIRLSLNRDAEMRLNHRSILLLTNRETIRHSDGTIRFHYMFSHTRHTRSLQNTRVAWQSASYVSRPAVRSAAAQTTRAALAFENETAGVIHAN